MAMNMREIPTGSSAAPRSVLDIVGTENSILGRIGNLETRLACTSAEMEAAQALRFKVFADEMGAVLPPECMRLRRDIDAYDAVCDHLLVLDRSIVGGSEEQIVGTYRLLRQDVARANTGFYSTSEFAVNDMLARHPEKRFVELGRSCVLPQYRNRRTVELLWQGNWAYALEHGIDAMFGCASLYGTRPEALAVPLSYMHHNHLATGPWAVSARPELYNNMDLMPREATDMRSAFNLLPPLIKGYLRVGAMIGDGAVVDRPFGTTDVMVILPIAKINHRYLNHYGTDASRFAS